MKAKELSIGQIFRTDKSGNRYRRVSFEGAFTVLNDGLITDIMALRDDNNVVFIWEDEEVHVLQS